MKSVCLRRSEKVLHLAECQRALSYAALCVFPWIQELDIRLLEVAGVARNYSQPVLQSSRRDDQIWLRERVTDFPSVLNQKSPGHEDVFGNIENAVREHGTCRVKQPVIQLRSST